MRKKKTLVVAIAVLALLGAALFFYMNKQPPPVSAEKALPEVRLNSLDGTEISLASLRGKPILVNLWATWCSLCGDELSDFGTLQEAYGDKLAVVIINRGESAEVVRQFSLGNNLENLSFLMDSKGSFYDAIGGFSMPETLFVNTEGKIVAHKRGPMSLEEMKRRVEDVFDLSLPHETQTSGN